MPLFFPLLCCAVLCFFYFCPRQIYYHRAFPSQISLYSVLNAVFVSIGGMASSYGGGAISDRYDIFFWQSSWLVVFLSLASPAQFFFCFPLFCIPSFFPLFFSFFFRFSVYQIQEILRFLSSKIGELEKKKVVYLCCSTPKKSVKTVFGL